MASKSEIVRLSHTQLAKLAQKYGPDDKDDETGHQSHGRRSEERDRQRKGKRPDRQIYQPGRTRLRRKPEDDDTELLPGGEHIEQEEEVLSNREGSTEKELEVHGLTQNLAQVNVVGSESSAMYDTKGKKRQKRPDQRIYIPKPRQMCQGGDEEHEQLEEGEGDPGGGLINVHAVFQSPGPSRRTVDVPPSNRSPQRKQQSSIDNMVVTVVNNSTDGADASPGGDTSNVHCSVKGPPHSGSSQPRTRSGSWGRKGDKGPFKDTQSHGNKELKDNRDSNQVQKPAKKPKGMSSGRSPVSQERRRHASGGSDFELNWSDVSHDSLEWDYQVEIEFGGSMNVPGDEDEIDGEDIEMEDDQEETNQSGQRLDSVGRTHDQGPGPPGLKKPKKKRERKPRGKRGKGVEEGQPGQKVKQGEKPGGHTRPHMAEHGTVSSQVNDRQNTFGNKGNRKKGQKDRQNLTVAEAESQPNQLPIRQRKDSDQNKDRCGLADSSDSKQRPVKQFQIKDSNGNTKQKGKELKNQRVKPEKNEVRERGSRQNKGRDRLSSGTEHDEVYNSESYSHHEKDLEKKGSKKPNLTVTFAKNERQVKMMSDRESSSEEREFRRGLSDHLTNTLRSQGGKVGGIIHLPPAQSANQTPNQDLASHSGPPHHGIKTWGGASAHKGRGRGGSHRTLYDPNNPTKSVPVPSSPAQLQFYDSYDSQYSPDSYPQGHHEDYPHDYGYEYRTAVPPRGYYEISYSDQPYSGSPHAHGDGFYGYSYPSSYHESGTYTDDTYSRDPYYHSGYEAELPGSRSRSASKQKAEALLREATPLESQLGNLLSRRIHGEEGMQKVMALRRDVQMKFEQVILMDPDLANCHNVEQTLWKSGFYQVIEVLRRLLSDNSDDDSAPSKEHLLALLEEGTSFYEGLLKNLQNSFAFQLDDFLDPNTLPPENLSRSVKLALLSAQRTLICLGDIARYKEQANHTTNYGKARSWYMKAQQIAPKNGRPYNQLAILALYTRRKLDAVYYYMRSLAASNPFITARESLMSLFDEARKKAEVTEKKRQQEHRKTQTLERKRSEDGTRVEIWISTDGSSSHGQQGDSDDDELKKLSTIELNKRFILSFLNVHGKLFTKIGMETFPEVSSQMLLEFSALLQHTPSPIGNVRLLQLMTINMFAVENTLPTEGTIDEGCRSMLTEQAVGLGLEMFGLLNQRCRELLHSHLALNDCQILSEDLHQLMPSVKVWSDWMTCHANLWNPPPLMRDPSLGPTIDVWKSIADLCNVLKQVDIMHVKLYSLRKEGCDPVVLGEDSMLAGFVPLLSLPQIPMFVHSTVDKEIARDCLRVEKFRTFGDYLCGIEPPLLSYNVETHQYVSIAPESLEEDSQDSRNQSLESTEGDDVIVESEEEVEISGGSSAEEENEIEALKARRAELQRKKDNQDRYARNVQNVLNHGNQTRPITLEIRPQFLVPDTNCFIDHLALVRCLLVAKRYTIVVPLTVINELDGLAKGSREGQYDTREHAEMVKANSQEAIDFVEAEFDGRNSRLRALTSKGTVLDTIAFRSEDTTLQGNNDDLILSCCLHYCKDKARDFMPKDDASPIQLLREVVLLTDDRNLRLKAHMRNVPVKDIQAFIKWAKVS